MTTTEFDSWLTRYGAAWESRDPDAAAALFTADAEYYWTPFGEPKRGTSEIAAAWAQATSRQAQVRFRFQTLVVSGNIGIAKWHTHFVRAATNREIEIDGILVADVDESGRCRIFREWWHSNEDHSATPGSEE